MMKVFEITTEHCVDDSVEIMVTVRYVTSESDTLKSIVDYYTEHCNVTDKILKGVREVLTIVNHISAKGKV